MVSNNFLLNTIAKNSSNNVNKNLNILYEKKGKSAYYSRVFGSLNKDRIEENTYHSSNPIDLTDNSDEINLHKDLRDLCINNDEIKESITRKWTHIDNLSVFNKYSCFVADVYKNKKTIAIVYNIKEMKNLDAQDRILNGFIPHQENEALDIYQKVKKSYPRYNIVVCGYSLGGSLAEYVAYIKKISAVTFNGFGMAHLFDNLLEPSKISNIIAYVTSDASTGIKNNHIGSVRTLCINEYTFINKLNFGQLNFYKGQSINQTIIDKFKDLEYYFNNFSGAA